MLRMSAQRRARGYGAEGARTPTCRLWRPLAAFPLCPVQDSPEFFAALPGLEPPFAPSGGKSIGLLFFVDQIEGTGVAGVCRSMPFVLAEPAGEIVCRACVVAAIPLAPEYIDAPITRHGVPVL